MCTTFDNWGDSFAENAGLDGDGVIARVRILCADHYDCVHSAVTTASVSIDMHADIANDMRLARRELVAVQRQKLAALFAAIRGDGHAYVGSAFYRNKFDGIAFDPSCDDLNALPPTTRAELQANQQSHPPYGTILTCDVDAYVRFHQTSSTSGEPLRWPDTRANWDWWIRCWQFVLEGAGVTQKDRVVFPFSFGPFVGFWSAFDAACQRGCLCLPAGGMSSVARLKYIADNYATVVCCTPTYALRLAEVAAAEGVDLSGLPVRALIVAGEPGGSIPATRDRIESAWGARVFDHVGMTEIGAWGFQTADYRDGVYVIESEFIAEVIDPKTLEPVDEGELGELVLTNLGRLGSPLIRYRTGDLVRLTTEPGPDGVCFARVIGGVVGRSDDMLVVRGNNVFPSAIEDVLRRFREVAEYRITLLDDGPLNDLLVEIEIAEGENSPNGLCERVSDALRLRLNFAPKVATVAANSLPRSEMKSRRVARQ
ncbi:MAG: AMP-binding protein [Phycisphaerae bacterium]|nr:AMP-binding protein [Phycisphaerales bacterium]